MMAVNEVAGNDRMGLFPDAERPDDNRAPLFRWCLREWKHPDTPRNPGRRAGPLRNGRG